MECIVSLLSMCCRSLTFSSSSSSAAAADAADDDLIPPPREKYDVFISFRGEDTRNTFTSHLHAALLRKKIETYIDYKLESGDEIAPSLREAIQKSKLSVVIFSKNYASSTWCLEELAHILECKERDGQFVVPLFYDIEPSHVRNQLGSYAVAFARLERRFKDSMDKVHKWRAALTKASNLSGLDNSDKTGTEANFVEKVVEDILTKLNHEPASDLKGLVGIESRIEQIKSLLCINDSVGVCTVGIWGMGGIGKTTLAEAVYHRLSSKFEACCFLEKVREEAEKRGLNHLRNELFRKILVDENLNIDTPSVGSTFVGGRLRRTKVLIVLDDVNHSSQLERLPGDDVQFGPGSRIIITTRDRSLLTTKVAADKIYKVKRLYGDEAHRLFQSHAFKNNPLSTDYSELSKMVVEYAGGMPLALKIFGSLFFPCKSKEERQDVLDNFKNSPSDDILDLLRLSYDGLKQKEKEMFLDIACFYKGEQLLVAERMLHIHGFDRVRDGVHALIDKSLISLNLFNCIEMHDVVQEMGWQIVRGECIKEAGKRSRLYNAKDVCHVLENNTGTEAVESIFFDMSKIQELHLSRAAFKKMHNLRVLKIYASGFEMNYCKIYLSQGVQSLPKALRYLCWNGCPFRSLPSKIFTENIVELHFRGSQLEQLIGKKGQNLGNLKVIDLCHCKNLTEVPDLSQSRQIERVDLHGCISLVQLPPYFQSHHKLKHLDLQGCSNFKYLPEMPESIEFLNLSETAIVELPSSVWSSDKISFLDISRCKYLERLPSNSCKLQLHSEFSLLCCSSLATFFELPRNMTVLNLFETGLEVLPSEIGDLLGLKEIVLRNCKRLVSLPTSICKLKSLTQLDLFGCSEFECFPDILEPMEHLKFLCLHGTAVKELPSSIDHLFGLAGIVLSNCKRLVSLPTSICKLKYLKGLDLTGCSKFECFPEILEPMENLKLLSLQGTAVKELPSSIDRLSGLCEIQLKDCKRLVSLPTSICKLKSLKKLDVSSCSEFECFPEILEPMENLEFLSLKGTAVKELPPSIGHLFGLAQSGSSIVFSGIELRECKRLVSLPTSICKLKSLEKLDLSGCSKFECFPEILEPMEYLKTLCLQGTAVKKLPSSIQNLSGLRTLNLSQCKHLQSVPSSIYTSNNPEALSRVCNFNFEILPPFLVSSWSLIELDLSYSGILEIPDRLICLTSLRYLDLSGTMIQSLPASIKKASQLWSFRLNNCKRLQSLPELPEVYHLEAYGCTSLKTVSSSKTAFSQDWAKYKYTPGNSEDVIFFNCLNLNQKAWSNIMVDAQLRILRRATTSSKFIEGKEEEEDYYGYEFDFRPTPPVTIVSPGNEIPNWFSHQNAGSSIDIKLSPNWFRTDFLGFALSVVVSFKNYEFNNHGLHFGCKSHFKTNSGKSHEFICDIYGEGWHETKYGGSLSCYGGNLNNLDSDHVFVWYNGFDLVGGEAKCSTPFCNVTEASVDFYKPNNYGYKVKVKRCGISLLYSEDAEKLEVMLRKLKVEEDTTTKTRSDESEAGGSEIFSSDKEQEELLPQRMNAEKNEGVDQSCL